ncbi:MAG: serralysin [Candidatus Liberibacter ctenarytainae]|uniref:Serralysin n=1 Tax=Candidatus Liberibacter ctenarytainae TaxID=2020335 RepID=A0A937DIQ1_9HYPH|nr:serralysin [Candidatus Liberibacter ctenarytainae]
MYNTKPVYTTEQIVDHLLRNQNLVDFLDRNKHALNVNITTLGQNGQNIVRLAMEEWSKVADITFNEVTDHADIHFISENDEYICKSQIGKQGIKLMEINLHKGDLQRYGTEKGTILFHNTLHEIGHALGLLHLGDYNGGYPTYGIDNDCANDSFLTSIMSYFDQYQNTMTNASVGYCSTPMVADILAVQKKYGAPIKAPENSLHIINVQEKGKPFVQTVYDSGGEDLLDLSMVGEFDNYVNLNPESWSNIGGGRKNVTFARDSIIEDVIGGDGSDSIIGNSADNVLYGGKGDDIFYASKGNDVFNGSRGFDTVVYLSPSSDYKIYPFEDEVITYDVGNNKVDSIRSVEKIIFSNAQMDLGNMQRKSMLEYTASYEDLCRSIGYDVDLSRKHLLEWGLKEERNILFDSYLYLGGYEDLRQAFGENRESAARHYIEYGLSEGRNPQVFDRLAYIASYEDLIKEYIHTDLMQSGKEHFSRYGYIEGRSVHFDPQLYLESYEDLRHAFGEDLGAASRHYINYGFWEGRNPRLGHSAQETVFQPMSGKMQDQYTTSPQHDHRKDDDVFTINIGEDIQDHASDILIDHGMLIHAS